jgi:hypothetical protein
MKATSVAMSASTSRSSSLTTADLDNDDMTDAPSSRTSSSKPQQQRAHKSKEVKDYVCHVQECAKAFARRSDLIRHNRIHTNER